MSTLWLLIAGLAVLAMLFVLIPVLRFRDAGSLNTLEQRREKNREVFEQRQSELETEVAEGIILPGELARMQSELKRAFMRDMDALEKEAAAKASNNVGRKLPLALMFLVPLLSIIGYQQWGSGPDLALPQIVARVAQATDEASQLLALTDLATALQGRFDRVSDDMQNGYMLGTLYMELDRFQEAANTFRRMLEQMEASPDKATVYGQLAQAQYMLEDSKLTDRVQGTIDQALALNPNEFSALSILAIDALLREDLPTALGYWRRQLASVTPGTQQDQTLRQRIAMVESYLPEGAASEESEAAVTGARLTVTIDIDPALKEQLGNKQSLFVYVRNPAIRPPLVAQNLGLPDFPFTLTLDNSMSMTGMTLESAPTLIVGARISGSGNAIAQSGDFQTVTEPFVLTDLQGSVDLVIDQVVP